MFQPDAGECYTGWGKSTEGTRGYYRESASKIIPIIKEAERKRIAEEIKNMELPSERGTNIGFKMNPKLTASAQTEVVDTAIMAYKQAEQDTHKAISDKLKGEK